VGQHYAAQYLDVLSQDVLGVPVGVYEAHQQLEVVELLTVDGSLSKRRG
jgi:hypothetical protein